MKRFSLTHLILCALFHALLALDHQMLRHIDQHATAPDQLCSASPVVRPSHNYHANKRLRREVSFAANDDKNAAYLNGTVGLRLRTTATEQNSVSETDGLLAKLRQTFTVQVWVKIEGGQVDPATIISVADVCIKDENVIVWQLGIGSSDGVGERESRLFFALHTEMAPRPTRLSSHRPFQLNQWLKLTVTYDGARMHFYVNGGRVGRTEQQGGPLFSEVRSSCKRFFLGIDIASTLSGQEEVIGFRGAVSGLKIWNRALTHEEIVNTTIAERTDLLLQENFDSIDQWLILGANDGLKLVKAAQLDAQDEYDIRVPACGQTVCDDPTVVRSYAANAQLRKHKRINYRVVNICEDDGTNPSVGDDQIRSQDRALNAAFEPYNISWALEVVHLSKTALRRKTIMFGCSSNKIGNKQCDIECRHPITGNDGGDCDDTFFFECDRALLTNGRCDSACNRREFNWDNGQCCNASNADVHKTCIDPQSAYRSYVSIDEYKELLNMTNKDGLTITFAKWSNAELIGLSTFPWEKEVHSIYGGIVLQGDRYGNHGHMKNLVHEVGHTLGLWHVHHGITEVPCDDQCRETHASMLTGDLVEDTSPTPKNLRCRDPDAGQQTNQCGDRQVFVNTPFSNYMSYAGDDCADHFTEQQVARMHCYLDLKYSAWLQGPRNADFVIPIPPRLIATSAFPNNSFTFKWVPPLGDDACRPSGSTSGHAECLFDGAVLQYAFKASSTGPFQLSGYWGPHQATGPPDAESCEASTKAWLPDVQSCDDGSDKCTLRLEPEMPLPAVRLSVWIAWNAVSGVRSIKLFYTDGTTESLMQVFAQCDKPYTTELDGSKNISQIEIRTSNPFVSIDAIQLLSPPEQAECSTCDRITYRVHRNPPFQDKSFATVYARHFTDDAIQVNQKYQYQVAAVIGVNEGELSPPLHFSWGEHFCGDGLLNDVEQCDDGNVADGDGCSSFCTVEARFHCRGEPSLCYIYSADGVCEDFERVESIQDCGYFTPEQFEDQWVKQAVAKSPILDVQCPLHKLVGPPENNDCSLVANSELWETCTSAANIGEMEISAYFDRPTLATAVLVHIAPDGSNSFGSDPKFIHVQLIDTDNQTHPIKGSQNVMLSCSTSPVLYPIVVDLSQPLWYTIGVRLTIGVPLSLAVSAIRLRSWRMLDPLAVARCANERLLFDPTTGQCTAHVCEGEAPVAAAICPSLVLTNGHVQCDGTSAESATCNVHCSAGYHLYAGDTPASNAVVFCHYGRWSTTVRCEPVDCGPPKIAHATISCPLGTAHGKRCTFQCVAPSKMTGDDNEIVCESNAIWSVPEAYCQLTCTLDDLSSRNAAPASLNCRTPLTNDGSAMEHYPVGTRCKMTCLAGHHVEEAAKNKQQVRMTCGDDGRWQGPKCVPVKCEQPKIVYFGLYNCTEGFDVGSKCRFFCPGWKESRMSTCKTDGTWSLTRPCPLPQLSCPRPVASQDFLVDCPRRLFVGTFCKVSCHAKNYEPVLEHIRTMDRGMQMQLLERVDRVSCTGRRTMEPAITEFACVKQCNREFMGDGWCDFQNNRGFCSWDGGDCCASTVKGGKVRLMFPTLCTSQLCQCIDPFATENRNDLGVRARLGNQTTGGRHPERKTTTRRALSDDHPTDRTVVESWLSGTIAKLSSENSFGVKSDEDAMSQDARELRSLETIAKYYKLYGEHRAFTDRYLKRISGQIRKALHLEYKRMQVKS